MAKNLLPIDALIAGYLRDGISEAGLTYRQIAAVTGMSINRLGIIFRQEPPPATVGEIGLIAATIGTSASELVERAEAEFSKVVQLRPNAADRIDFVDNPHVAVEKVAAKRGTRRADEQPAAE